MEIMSDEAVKRIRQECCILCEKSLLVADCIAYYRLMERPPQYFAECVYESEARIFSLGQRFPHAVAMFALLVEGEVTPCTAGDVLRDFQTEHA